MRPIPPYGTDARFIPQQMPKRPGAAPRISADSRPGHPRNAAPAPQPVKTFNDWALL
jgi:hypothetical protein